MWNGTKRRVTLDVDLTRYHHHLTPGATGVLVPGVKTTMYGRTDRFGAVCFDCCGVTMDIVLSNLIMGDPAPEPKCPVPEPEQAPPEPWTEEKVRNRRAYFKGMLDDGTLDERGYRTILGHLERKWASLSEESA